MEILWIKLYLENENNDTDYLITALHALSNHHFNENGKNYAKLDFPKVINYAKIYNQNIILIQIY